MFNQYSNFKSATTAAYNAMNANSKLSLTQFREELVKNTPFGSTATYKASFKNDAIISEQQSTLTKVFIVTEKRDERLYTSVHSSYRDALTQIKNDLKNDIDDTDMVVDFFDHLCVKRPTNIDEASDLFYDMIDKMNEEALVKVNAWLYSENAPLLQVTSSTLNNTQEAPYVLKTTTEIMGIKQEGNLLEDLGFIDESEEKESFIEQFFSLPEVCIAKKITELGILDVHYDLSKGFTNEKEFPYSDDYLVLLVTDYANKISLAQLNKDLTVESQYILQVSELVYTHCNDGKIRIDSSHLPTNMVMAIPSAIVDTSDLMESLVTIMDDAILEKTGFNYDGARIGILKCTNNELIRMNR